MRAQAHWSIAYALRQALSARGHAQGESGSKSDAPVVAHDDADAVALVYAHGEQAAGEGHDVGVELGEGPVEVGLAAALGAAAERVGLLVAAHERGAVCMGGEDVVGKVGGEGEVGERRLCGALDVGARELGGVCCVGAPR